MKDLTTGSVSRHLLTTTSFMLVSMVFQTLYFLIDLYWVGRLGTHAVAAVGIAGNLSFVVLGLTQMLGVGTTTVIAHAVGRKDYEHGRLLFNQSQGLAFATGFVFLIVGVATLDRYAAAMSADAATEALAREYLIWFIPAMALQFALVSMGSALRGVGNFKTGMWVSTVTVLINMVLAPFLIFGWGTGRAFGVAGAAVASLVAITIGLVWLTIHFLRHDSFLKFDPRNWRPQIESWKRILAIGMPAGIEFALTALYMVVIYAIMRPFGAAAQAGFGIGARIVQAGFMPVVALGFSVAPVAGQNFGARLPERVKATFRDAAMMATVAMAIFAIASQVAPRAMMGIFTRDPAVIDVGAQYLRIVSWNYVAAGLIFVNASMFQAMGNTIPSLVASVVRNALVIVPALVLSKMPGFQLTWLWYLSVGAAVIQLVLSMLLLRREFGRRLNFTAA